MYIKVYKDNVEQDSISKFTYQELLTLRKDLNIILGKVKFQKEYGYYPDYPVRQQYTIRVLSNDVFIKRDYVNPDEILPKIEKLIKDVEFYIKLYEFDYSEDISKSKTA